MRVDAIDVFGCSVFDADDLEPLFAPFSGEPSRPGSSPESPASSSACITTAAMPLRMFSSRTRTSSQTSSLSGSSDESVRSRSRGTRRSERISSRRLRSRRSPSTWKVWRISWPSFNGTRDRTGPRFSFRGLPAKRTRGSIVEGDLRPDAHALERPTLFLGTPGGASTPPTAIGSGGRGRVRRLPGLGGARTVENRARGSLGAGGGFGRVSYRAASPRSSNPLPLPGDRGALETAEIELGIRFLRTRRLDVSSSLIGSWTRWRSTLAGRPPASATTSSTVAPLSPRFARGRCSFDVPMRSGIRSTVTGLDGLGRHRKRIQDWRMESS